MSNEELRRSIALEEIDFRLRDLGDLPRLCPRCGAEMEERKCGAACGRCGASTDCDD